MLAYRVLIYESDDKAAQRLAALARQAGMAPLIASTAAEAQALIKENFMELALVNLSLERVPLSEDTRSIGLGEANERCAESLLYYKPEAVIAYPFSDPAALFNIIRVSGIVPVTPTLPCQMVELTATLDEEIFRIKTLLALEDSRLTFRASVEKYCHFSCAFSKPSSELTAAEVKEYVPIFMGSGRGHLMCKFFNRCMLYRLADHLEKNAPDLAKKTPAAIMSSPISQETSPTLLELIAEARKSCRSWSETLLATRKDLCQSTCLVPDEKGAQGEMVKKPCCDFGCVLDNYFDITPDKRYLKAPKAIIYENNASDAGMLEFMCREFSIQSQRTADPKEALDFLTKEKFDFAIVNPELTPLQIPQRVRVIIADYMSLALIARILTYRPVSIIPKPFDLAKLSLGFIQALGLPFPQTSQFASINNLAMALERAEIVLQNRLMVDTSRSDINESTKYFCENRCCFATPKHMIKEEDKNRYNLLDPFSRRGAIYCLFRPKCRLWTFTEYVKNLSTKPEILSPLDALRTPLDISEHISSMDRITNALTKMTSLSNAINDLRQTFCTQICDKRRSDMDIQHGDICFSAFREVMAKNAYSYCREPQCPLILFFEYFKKIMI